MVKRIFIVVGVAIVLGFLVLSGGNLLSIFGPSGPTQTDTFVRDGITGTYWTNERGLGIMDRTGVLNQLMDAPLYESGEVMTARAGLIISNPRALGFDAYALNSARYAWVALNENDVAVLPGRSTSVTPANWPLVFSPPDMDPGNRLIYDFAPDSWVGNGQEGVGFMSFSLIVGYSMQIGGVWEQKLELFTADGADITPLVVPPEPPPEDPPIDPPPPIDDPPVNGDGGEGETEFDFSAVISSALPYVMASVAFLVVFFLLVFLPIPAMWKVVALVITLVVLYFSFPLFVASVAGG